MRNKFKVLFRLSMIYIINFLTLIIYLIPRRNQIIFIGKNDSLFLDNIKYLYLYRFDKDKIKKIFITFDKNEFIKLQDKINIYYLFSFKGIYFLLISKYLVVDNINWSEKYLGLIYLLSRGNKKIQLWHGYPIKKIEYDNEFDKSIQLCKKRVTFKEQIIWSFRFMRCVKYNLLLIPSTNKKIIKIFKSAFRFDKYILVGYPRNEFLLYPEKFLNWDKFISNIYQKIKILKNEYKIVLFLPTFRDDDSLFITKNDLLKLNDFAKKKNFIFVIKPHPWDIVLDRFLKELNLKNIVRIDRFEDIYPYLHLSDMLITDISSIGFDYLLIDKPILHFFPDKEKYMKNMRDVYFNLKDILSGPLIENIDELLYMIDKILIKNIDEYEIQRKKIKKLVFGEIEHNSDLIYKGILHV
jgi:CDP-glycerol glycerophosphotransferase (TagB/SpsB family)